MEEQKKTHRIEVRVLLDGKTVFNKLSILDWPLEKGNDMLPQKELRCEACKLVHGIPLEDWTDEQLKDFNERKF